MRKLEASTGAKSTNSPHPTSHAVVLNEYDWIWLNRDGSPAVLSVPLFQRLLGKDAGASEVVDLAAYLWAGLTEYWRAHRTYAGVLCFTYLTASHRDAYTGDFFQDVQSLKLQPGFEEALANSFSPVGVYLNFWQPTLAAGSSHAMAVSLVNDEYEMARGKLVLAVATGGLPRTSASRTGCRGCAARPTDVRCELAHSLRERPLRGDGHLCAARKARRKR